MRKNQAVHLTAFITVLLLLTVFVGSPSARAEDCSGVQPNSCVLDEDPTGNLLVNGGAILTIGADVTLNFLIDGVNVDPSLQGRIITDGAGRTVIQQNDIGSINRIFDITVNNGDIWFVSNGADIDIQPLRYINLVNGGQFSVDPNSGTSNILANILGDASDDVLDYISGGQSYGITGNIGFSSGEINLGAGDDRFIYQQNAGSTINAGTISLGTGNNVFGFIGTSAGSVFSGDVFFGLDNDTLVFYSGSDATVGSFNSTFNFGFGDDTVDFASGVGVASGTIIADTFDLNGGDDFLPMLENATIQVDNLFDAGEGNDLITFTNGGYIDAQGATFTLGDGDDVLQFNDIAFIAGVQGLDVSDGLFRAGAGNDSLIFVSSNIGLNASNALVDLGLGDDNITFLSSTGVITFVSGSSFLNIDGGVGTDSIFFASTGVPSTVSFGDANGGGSIVNLEVIDLGDGTLSYNGTIDSNASIVNFTSADFWGAGTSIAATVNGDPTAETLQFMDSATFTGIAFMSSGNDIVNFSSAFLTGTVNLEDGDDTFRAGGGAVISGTVDGGSNVNDSLLFDTGLTTVTGSIINFTSGVLNAGSTVNVTGSGSILTTLAGTGALQYGTTGSTANSLLVTNAIDQVNLQVIGDTLSTNGIALGQTTPLSSLLISDGSSFIIDSDVNATGGALNVDGTARISPGVTLSADSYNNGTAGNFIFEINSDLINGITTVGQLLVTGAGQDINFVSSGDVLQFVLGPISDPLFGDTISFISAGAGGTVTAPPDANVLGDTILYDISVVDANANPQDLELVITELNTINGLTTSQNNETIANVLLVDLLNSQDPDIAAIRDGLLNAANGEEFNQILEGARPILHAGEVEGINTVNRKTFGLINQRLAMLREDPEGETGLNTGEVVEELEAWWQFYAQTAAQKGRNSISGYDATTFGLAGGIDREIFDDAFFGFSFSWGDTTVNSKGFGDADTNVDTYQIAVYGDYDFGGAYINTMASFSYNDISTSKTSVAGTRTSNYHANSYSARGELGYAFMAGKTRLIPNIMGHYSYFSPEAYIEEGPGAQIIAADSLRRLDVGVGLDMQWIAHNGLNSYFVPSLSLGYRYNLADETYTTNTEFVAGGPAFEQRGFDPEEQSFDIGLGLTYFSEENWELLFHYDFELKEDYDAHAGMIRAAYKFYP